MSDLNDLITKLIDAAGPGHVWVPADFAFQIEKTEQESLKRAHHLRGVGDRLHAVCVVKSGRVGDLACALRREPVQASCAAKYARRCHRDSPSQSAI